jgi:hypothetical protein
MSVKVITSYNDEDFSEVSEMFYNSFSPDDWDYMIIGEDIREVEDLAYKLKVYDYTLKEIEMIDPMTNWKVNMWVAVTYHS